MKEQEIPMMKAILAVVAIVVVASAQGPVPVHGEWKLTLDDDLGEYQIAFDQNGESVGGTAVLLPDGDPVEVEEGRIIVDQLKFTTVDGGVEYRWAAVLGRSMMAGIRTTGGQHITFSGERIDIHVVADSKTSYVCGIPPDEAVAVTQQVERTGTWWAHGPLQRLSMRDYPTEMHALAMVSHSLLRREGDVNLEDGYQLPTFACASTYGGESVRVWRLHYKQKKYYSNPRRNIP